MTARKIGWNAGISDWLMIALDLAILIAVVAVAVYLLRKRLTLWRIGKPENRTDQIGKRIHCCVEFL